MNTSKITKDVHVHKPQTRVVMTYNDESGKKQAILLNPGDRKAEALILRTIRWASYRGIEITFRPV